MGPLWMFIEAKDESKLGTDDGGGGGTRGFSASGGGEVGAAESRFCDSAWPANASRSAVRLETKDLTLPFSVPPSSVNSR